MKENNNFTSSGQQSNKHAASQHKQKVNNRVDLILHEHQQPRVANTQMTNYVDEAGFKDYN